MTDGDDDDQHRDDRQQIDLPGIVTTGLYFPAHLLMSSGTKTSS
jgi:hypothetical protein